MSRFVNIIERRRLIDSSEEKIVEMDLGHIARGAHHQQVTLLYVFLSLRDWLGGESIIRRSP
jgi:hypothetical protein